MSNEKVFQDALCKISLSHGDSTSHIGEKYYDCVKIARTALASTAETAEAKPDDDSFLLRDCAKTFYNLTMADESVRISAPTKKKQDAISSAALTLRHALTKSPEYVAHLAPQPQPAAPEQEAHLERLAHSRNAMQAISLLSSMVSGGEDHSDTSRQVVAKAVDSLLVLGTPSPQQRKDKEQPK